MKDDRISSNKIIDNSVSFARSHCNEFDVKIRKSKGQFFTPKKVANFMASCVNLDYENIRILDPGAGTGILVAAVCDRIADRENSKPNITIDVYENDENLIPLLKNTIDLCYENLQEKTGQKLSYNIFESNFILDNNCPNKVNQSGLEKKEQPKYDLVISNPPYFKLNVQSPESRILKEFVFGQPNIYPLFMITSMNLLKDGGSFIFIIPRSFCSGLYYKKIRNWFVDNTQIKIIHCFESRLKIFEDNVTQETVIFFGTKAKPNIKPIEISISEDKTFKNHFSFFAPKKMIFEEKSGDSFIRIPHSQNEIKIIQEIDSWENSLNTIGLEISTGKVVDFRTKENLVFNLADKGWVPLLWMHNLRNGSVEWPSNKYSKPQGILLNDKTKNLVIPLDNYILLKRFTSKNQIRRLYATPISKKGFEKFSFVGLENHLNYIYGVLEPISMIDQLGITALLNSSFYDEYYRALSGNTQVNANEMRKIPLPDYKKIKEIGRIIKNTKNLPNKEMDLKIGKILNFDKSLLKIIQEL